MAVRRGAVDRSIRSVSSGSGITSAVALIDAALPEWYAEAVCAQTSPEEFFPEKGGTTKHAKQVCLGCTVREQCLQDALDRDERFGVWGGLSERERRQLKHQQQTALNAAKALAQDTQVA